MQYPILKSLVKEDFGEVLQLMGIYRMPKIIEASLPVCIFEKIVNSAEVKLGLLHITVGGNRYAEFVLSGYTFKIKVIARKSAKYRNFAKRNT